MFCMIFCEVTKKMILYTVIAHLKKKIFCLKGIYIQKTKIQNNSNLKDLLGFVSIFGVLKFAHSLSTWRRCLNPFLKDKVQFPHFLGSNLSHQKNVVGIYVRQESIVLLQRASESPMNFVFFLKKWAKSGCESSSNKIMWILRPSFPSIKKKWKSFYGEVYEICTKQ